MFLNYTFEHDVGSLSLNNSSKLTDDSCAIPIHVLASQEGSRLFLGFSLSVETAAELCSPDLSPLGDMQTWMKQTGRKGANIS